MEVTAHHDNLRPPFMKKHLSPDKPKGHGEQRLQQSGGMWSLFSYSLWSSFYFVIICVFVLLQLCSYDVLCASVDVKWWKPVHV